MGNVISKQFSTRRRIKDGKVFIKWTGTNNAEILEELKKAIKSVRKTIGSDEWEKTNER